MTAFVLLTLAGVIAAINPFGILDMQLRGFWVQLGMSPPDTKRAPYKWIIRFERVVFFIGCIVLGLASLPSMRW